MRQVERSVFLAAHGTKRLRRSQRASRADQRPGAAVAEVLARKYCDHSRKRAKQLEPLIRELRDKNYSVTMELNKRKVPTPRHGAVGLFFFQWFKRPLDVAPYFYPALPGWSWRRSGARSRQCSAMHLFAYQ